MLVCKAVGLAHLPENLCLAQHHGIQTRRNPEEVPHRFPVVVVVQRFPENVGPHGVKLAEKSGKSRRAFMGRFRRNSVHFAAIAGGENQRLFENSPGAKLFRGSPGLLGGE